MTTVLLVGLSDHDAAAMEILISTNWRQKRCVLLKRTANFSLPVQSAQASKCAKVVADLGGMGLHQYNPENGTRLLAFLAGRPALLLTWKNDGGWKQADLELAPGQRLEFLAAPYGSADVKAALAALDAPASAPSPAPSPAPAAAQPATTSTYAPSVSSSPSNPSAGAAVGLPAPALTAILPALGRSRFVRLVEKLPKAGVQVLHIASTELLLHPQEGWVGASMPVSALLRVLGNAEQLEQASTERLSSVVAPQIEQHITAGRGQRYMLALDVVLWDLCSHALAGRSLQLAGDAVFKLARFPNFTLLGQVGALDVQLAALCVRGEQSVAHLLRCFAGQEAAVLRFVALAVLSGLGQLQAPALNLNSSTAGKPVKSENTRGHKERRGFLRSLLDKLF